MSCLAASNKTVVTPANACFRSAGGISVISEKNDEYNTDDEIIKRRNCNILLPSQVPMSCGGRKGPHEGGWKGIGGEIQILM